MNKIRATRKEMQQNYQIASIGYCDAQYLLKYESPVAYTAGINGWQADYYDIDGVVISTGYNPIAEKNIKCDYKTIKHYDNQARGANTKEEIDVLLKEFIAEIKKGGEKGYKK